MKLTKKQKWLYCYMPTTILYALPLGGFIYLFGEGFNPDVVMFSNDGPLGVANSQWMRDGYFPGGAMWVDSWWLGEPGGRNPIAFTQFFYWLCLNPLFFIPILLIGFTICGYVIIKDIQDSPKDIEKPLPAWKPEPAPEPKSQEKWCSVFRYTFPFLAARFAFISFQSLPTISGIEACLWLAYFLFGPLIWIELELENYRYEKNLVH